MLVLGYIGVDFWIFLLYRRKQEQTTTTFSNNRFNFFRTPLQQQTEPPTTFSCCQQQAEGLVGGARSIRRIDRAAADQRLRPRALRPAFTAVVRSPVTTGTGASSVRPTAKFILTPLQVRI